MAAIDNKSFKDTPHVRIYLSTFSDTYEPELTWTDTRVHVDEEAEVKVLNLVDRGCVAVTFGRNTTIYFQGTAVLENLLQASTEAIQEALANVNK